MKVYKVTQETKIINYQPVEENHAHFYTKYKGKLSPWS